MTLDKPDLQYTKMDASPSVHQAVRDADPDQEIQVYFKVNNVEALFIDWDDLTITSRVWTSKVTMFTGAAKVKDLERFERDDSVISYSVTSI